MVESFGAFVDVFAFFAVLLGCNEAGHARANITALGEIEAFVFATASVQIAADVVMVAAEFIRAIPAIVGEIANLSPIDAFLIGAGILADGVASFHVICA